MADDVHSEQEDDTKDGATAKRGVLGSCYEKTYRGFSLIPKLFLQLFEIGKH